MYLFSPLVFYVILKNSLLLQLSPVSWWEEKEYTSIRGSPQPSAGWWQIQALMESRPTFHSYMTGVEISISLKFCLLSNFTSVTSYSVNKIFSVNSIFVGKHAPSNLCIINVIPNVVLECIKISSNNDDVIILEFCDIHIILVLLIAVQTALWFNFGLVWNLCSSNQIMLFSQTVFAFKCWPVHVEHRISLLIRISIWSWAHAIHHYSCVRKQLTVLKVKYRLFLKSGKTAGHQLLALVPLLWLQE